MNMGGVEEGGILGKAVMDIVSMFIKRDESWGMQNMSMARYRPKVGPVSLIFQSFNGVRLNVPALSLMFDFDYPTSAMANLFTSLLLSLPIKSCAEACVIIIPPTRIQRLCNPVHPQWQQLLAP